MRSISAIVGASLLIGLAIVAPDVSGGLEAQASPPAAPADSYEVFRPYGAAGGLKDEFEQLAAEHPDITKLVTIGQTVQGEDIVALKVSRHASRIRDGRRPATLYVGGQHGREWISAGDRAPPRPPRDRRLPHRPARSPSWSTRPSCGSCPVANPDGYDFTFTPGNRLWRKNLRDNDGDGRITAVDGVDPNRNYPTKWGYDDEGSSPDAGSEAYRGTGPASEPETRAVDRLMARVGFEFLVNYHSASEGVLYGTGWQVATPTPDDALYEALVGDHGHPRRSRLSPGLTADLYSGNGILDEHAHLAYGTLGVLVEMSHVPNCRLGRPCRRVGSRRLHQRVPLPRRRGADRSRVPQEPAVRPLHRPVGRRPGRPGDRDRAAGARVRGRQLRRVLRRPADRRRDRPARPAHTAPRVPGQRRPHPAGRTSASGRAVSATATSATATTPSSGAR